MFCTFIEIPLDYINLFCLFLFTLLTSELVVGDIDILKTYS